MSTKKEIKPLEIEFAETVKGTEAKLKPTEESKEIYVKTLIENGLTEKEVRAVNDFNAQYIKRASKTIPKVAGETLNKNKDLTHVNVEVPFGFGAYDRATYRVTREKTTPIPGTGKTVTGPAIALKVETTFSGMGSSFRKELREELEDILAKG